MMRLSIITVLCLPAAEGRNLLRRTANSTKLLTDLSVISQYWGEISPYSDNAADYFGVEDAGIPSGCQLEQAHSLQRHANRFPTSGADDGGNDERFAQKVTNFTSPHPAKFTRPL